MRRWGRSLQQNAHAPIDIDEDSEEEPKVSVSREHDENCDHANAARNQEIPQRDLSQLTPCISVDSEEESDRMRISVDPKPLKVSNKQLGVRVAAAAGACVGVRISPTLSLSFANAVSAGQRRSQPFEGPKAKKMRICSGQGAHSTQSAKREGIVVWLRHFDVRLHDHPAFSYASRQGKPTYVFFPWSHEEDAMQGDWKLRGTASALFLFCALQDLELSLREKYGINIIFCTCVSSAEALVALARKTNSAEVVTSQAFDPMGMAADKLAQIQLADSGIKLKTFNSFLLHDIDHVRTDMGTYRGHFGTLMPFYVACSSRSSPPPPLPVPPSLVAPSVSDQQGQTLMELQLIDMPLRQDGSVVDWATPILDAWDISEKGALSTLRQFLTNGTGLHKYESGRHFADASAVARISPYLRFGMLSSRLMYHELKAAGGKHASVTFWRKLTWRDLSYWQLRLFPNMRDKPIRAHYDGQWWSADQSALRAWQKGETGYPLVDAGMRELWVTGWMAQNVRMTVAVFLCELLNIHWVEGEKWFHHTLVDADPAINAMMWQNAGKSGLDQWNFTMHPVSSGRRQDPSGNYVRKWCPELAGLPTKYIHAPWDAPSTVLNTAGVVLGKDGCYPNRILADVSKSAAESMHSIREQRGRMLEFNDENGYDLIRLPHGATISHDGQLFRVFTKKDYRLNGSATPTAPSGGKGYSAFSGTTSKGGGRGTTSKGGGKRRSSQTRWGNRSNDSGSKSKGDKTHDGFQTVMSDFLKMKT